tara:strand:- start:2072 stop:2560 length:489 start_codon:yes stop_codon:yes gene_type:complete
MSYLLNNVYVKATGDLNVYHEATATIGNDEPVTFATLDTSFSSNFSLTKNNSQFTIPNDNKTYLLEASLVNVNNTAQGSYLKYQWYDVTNSSYVGIKAKVSGGLNISEGRSGNIVCDEKAVYVTNQNNIYELRIVSYSGTSAVDNNSAGSYYNRARCLIWRY